MAAAVDSFQHLVDLFYKDLNVKCGIILRGLAVVGAIYITKKFMQSAHCCYSDLKVYGISRLCRTPLTKYGNWAGCEDAVVAGFAGELVQCGFNLIVISDGAHDKQIDSLCSRQINVVIHELVFDTKDMEKSIEGVESALNGKDVGIFVCKSGLAVSPEKKLHDLTREEIEHLIRADVELATQLYSIAISHMIQKNGGVIITVMPCHHVFPIGNASTIYIKTLLYGMKEEYKVRGIEFLNLIPYDISLKRQTWRALDLFSPSPSLYARSALTTVGWTSETTGYFPHQLQMRLSGLVTALFEVIFY